MVKAAQATAGRLLTPGRPNALRVEHGHLVYGVEPPRPGGEVRGLDFQVCGIVPDAEGCLAYGLRRGREARPEVWRAHTRDGIVFRDAERLFEVPPPRRRWLQGDVAFNGETLLLLICEIGSQPGNGHEFHAFRGPLAGGAWKRLSAEPVYRGQDAFGLVWNGKLQRFVNYQTTYQPWAKRYPDNMARVRRVMHIRTSHDGVAWTPGGSSGISGPYLPPDQLIVPDPDDPPETEFYKFRAIDLGGFWAGTMVKYISQPPLLPKSGAFPHGPFLGCEWWVSANGVDWERPFRANSGLEGLPWQFSYFLAPPVVVGEELRWPVNGQVYVADLRRMLYAYCHANAEVTTPVLVLSGRTLAVEVSFESVRRKELPNLRQGYLMAEMLDESGQVIAGFERTRCIHEASDSKRLSLRWGDQCLPPSPAGRTVRLRLCFRDVRLYSVAY
jgi:hypothetical protein